MPLDHYSVLVVDDNPGDAELACERLQDAPGCRFETRCATALASALDAIAERKPDAVILDLNLPDSSGLDTLHRVRAATPEVPLIVVSGAVDAALRGEILAGGAEDVLSKDEATGRLFSRSVLYVIERQRARLEHRQLEQLLDATPDAMLAINADGHVRFVNSAALTMLGRTRDELMRERLALSVEDGATIEVTLQSRDGPRVCEMRVVAMEWSGERTHLASMRDITERKQSEELRRRSIELELQNERMRQSNELKTAFVAHMSHEIRTPMNAVLGMGRLLSQTNLDGDQRAMLARLQDAGNALMSLLNNVLDLSKIEAGEVVLESLSFELPPLLHAVTQMLTAQAEEKGLCLDLELHPATPRWLQGDPTRLRQILTNLLGNAVKFTEHGSVVLAVGPVEGEPDRLRFVVRDTGVGIEPEALGRLFTPFTQADASTTRRFGGTGLGLSIVRHIAELMGGSVVVQSAPGAGSEFVVSLPLAEGVVGEVADSCVRLLCAGDAGGPRLAELAAGLGWHVETLPEVNAAAALRRRLRDAPLPDLVVVDGTSAPWVSAALDGMRSDAAMDLPPCLHLRADLAGRADLFDRVCTALAAKGRDIAAVLARTRMDDPALRWLPGVRLLVVDDSDINREVARRLLEGQGAEVETCDRAASALRRLGESPDAFDAVLMDVQMPLMDGNEATRRLRSDPRLAELPVIALTAGALVVERQRALDAGMTDFLAKPLDPPALVRTLRRHIDRRRGGLLAVEDALRDSAHAGWPECDQIRTTELTQRFGHDVELYARLMGQLLCEHADLHEAGAQAATPADAASSEALRARMHKLRGGAGTLGAVQVARRAAALESALAMGDEGIAPLLGGVADALAALIPPFEAWLARLPRSEQGDAVPAPASLDADLRRMLSDRDLAAITCVRSYSGALRQSLGGTSFEDFREAVERLDFVNALQILEAA